MSRFSSCSKKNVKGYALSALSSLMFLGAPAHGGSVPAGQTHTIDNSLPPEDWTLNAGSTLISNGAETLIIGAESALFNAVGGSAQRLDGRLNSTFNLTNASVDRIGGGFAIRLSDSTANLTNSTVTSDDIGLQLIRNNAGQIGSTVTLTNNSSVTALNGGALMTGFSQLNVLNSSIEATDATSYGVRLSHADLNAAGSTIIGGLNGLEVGREIVDLARTSAVTLDSSTIEGKSGSAIVVGFQDRAGITANIDVLNGSRLVGANGTMLEVNDGAAVNLKVDRSDLAGNIIVESGSTAKVTLQNASILNGNLQNVTQTRLDTRSTLNGEVQAVAGTGAMVSLDNGSVVNGNINHVFSLSLNNGSSMTGDVLTDTNGSVLLDNGSVLTGQINNSSNLSINNAAQWVMTGNSAIQNLTSNGGIVRMGTNEQFLRLDVANFSGKGTVFMGTDLRTGDSDFFNAGRAEGQLKFDVTPTGHEPLTAEDIHIGNINSGNADVSLNNRETVDAGTFVYRLAREGEGLYLRPDKKTVSTSTNTALALAGSARSIMNAETALLSDQLGERGMNDNRMGSLRAADDGSVKNLSNSVWLRTYGNQYNVKNAYGNGYTQNQTGITAGADTTVELAGRSWVLGGFVGSSHTRMDLKYDSSASVDSLNVGVYGNTFDVESGVFVNVMAKINQFDNKANVTMSDGTRAKGDYKALGASGSVAVGKHIPLANGYFAEPLVQVSTGATKSKKYQLDNGLEVKSDTMRSVQGKVGVRGGRVITLDNGSLLEPSLMTAFNHEFVKSNEVKINSDSFDDDRGSRSIEYGAGLKWMPTQRNWQVSGQVGGSKGNTVSQEWSGSLRVSYFF
ncbi:autotransporter outer membrane beta-barrel domain-containing protein [Pseudomonas sp. FP1740]|uniref:autotransporter outer membrane beta-barrel domain-containing protein n=1 Tax=unclassified Pseudomonas TaxID=196821 RepID=UPI002732AC80|nr:autotransporter outer membrane beta-barrel domain-containing protein [Pseudomonas sp. FP1740]WLG42361.1 autotransporter outer membrane beta-barrel domain-containing protein [Pseudomonas sp. FP1740]